MLRYTRITCAVDLSECSRVAADCAVALARQLGAELTFVHVREPGGRPEGISERILERWRLAAENELGQPVRSRLLAGDAPTEIARDVGDSGCELLVVGTHRRSGVSRLFLGSVAERLVRTTPCPVLVAPACADEHVGT